jgi:hypothetical protein
VQTWDDCGGAGGDGGRVGGGGGGCVCDDLSRKSKLGMNEVALFEYLTWDGVTQAQLIEHADKVLKPIQCVGLNPCKIVEMYKNYRTNVPILISCTRSRLKRCSQR